MVMVVTMGWWWRWDGGDGDGGDDEDGGDGDGDGGEPDLQPHVYLSRILPAEIQIYNLAGSPLMERLSDERIFLQTLAR